MGKELLPHLPQIFGYVEVFVDAIQSRGTNCGSKNRGHLGSCYGLLLTQLVSALTPVFRHIGPERVFPWCGSHILQNQERQGGQSCQAHCAKRWVKFTIRSAMHAGL